MDGTRCFRQGPGGAFWTVDEIGEMAHVEGCQGRARVGGPTFNESL